MTAKRAIAYYRTSSAVNVGPDKDSEKRQRDAVSSYAERNGIEIAAEYYDAAVSGTDSVGDRPEFSRMLSFIAQEGVEMVLVENASRFARDLIVQLTGHAMLKKAGITLIPVDAPDHFTNETPTAILIRQVLGAVAEFGKSCTVDQLRQARDRIRRETGRCEGRKPVPLEIVKAACDLRAGGLSYRKVASELVRSGHRQYGAESIRRMTKED